MMTHSNTCDHRFCIRAGDNFSKVVSENMDDVTIRTNEFPKKTTLRGKQINTLRPIMKKDIFLWQ